MGRARRILAATAVTAVMAAFAQPALGSGPITRGLRPASTRTLKPGITLSVYKMRVNDHGHSRSVKVWKISWKAGNPHMRLDSGVLGAYNADDRSVRLGRISSWAGWGAPSGLVAAINGDFFSDSWRHIGAGIPSGVLIHDRRVYSFGWGGPSAGFKPGGDIAMGRPQVVPAKFMLPGRKTATLGAVGELPARADQVAVFTTARVSIPAGGTGFVLDSTAPELLLRGSRTLANRSGLNVSEPVVGFRIEEPSSAYRTVGMHFLAPPTCASGVCPAGSQVGVPAGATVLVTRATGLAADGLAAKVAAHGVLQLSVDDAGWETVDDVMGGKPQLVANGRAISNRPTFVDPWQWSQPHWRPALVRAANGTAWLALTGGAWGSGVWADTWARMLTQMGAQSALGFDNNSSAELYRPGTGPLTAFDWERSIPSAVALSYVP
jgi:hypothetical protein